MEGGILADSTQTPGAGPSRSPSISSASTASSHSRVESRKGKSPQRNGERSANPTKDDSSSDRRFVRSPRHTGDNIGVAAASVRSEESEDGDDDGPDEDDAGDGAEGGDDEEEDEEEEEDDDDDEGDEGDEEEEEPTLKYSKMKGKMPEILAKDTASTIEVGSRMIAVGTHMGMVHVVSHEGIKINSFRPHAASVTCLRIDEESDFIATASVEGRVVIHSFTSTESYAFDYKRPMRALALEPGFGKKTSRSFVCGGMAGNLILQEKGWLGYKEQVLHSGEGPIWAVEWRNNIIAWANDTGVKLYDTTTGQRIGYIDRGAHAPRAELFKCSMIWKDDHTLVIAWADYIKVVRIRARGKTSQNTGLPALTVELTSIFQVDCMISGIATYGPTSFLVLAYVPPDSYTFDNEATDNPQEQKRKAANRPELRIIDKGEEISADALSLQNFHLYGCNDYTLAAAPIPVPTSTSPKPNTVRGGGTDDLSFFVVSPSDIIVVRPRDEADHIEWLVDQERYEEALAAAEVFKQKHGGALDIQAIGRKYMKHLVHRDEFERAAGLAAKVFQRDTASWRECIEEFIRHDQLKVLVNEIPTKEPVLEKETYMTVLSHLLLHDKELLLRVIRAWPRGIYNIEGAAETIQGELRASDEDPLLIESMGELYLTNQQPGKALPYFLRLRQPRVFDLVREYSLFADVQDQAVLLVELDDESKQDGAAIKLLVDHTDSIPIERVVRQLERKPEFLLRYLQGIFAKDAPLSFPYSDRYIDLAATYKAGELMPFLRASNMYDLEKAYNTCKDHDLVPEMVFLLGRMGNNRQALMLIIQRLGDVQMAIDFAREQADEDLWEDLLEYSETRPDFIRTLLEHVGAEINPIRLISRIRDGMEIPGLKAALIKIVQASNLQVSLSEGCNRILSGDCAGLASRLQKGQVGCVQGSPQSVCAVCHNEAFKPGPSDTTSSTLVLVYLCRHTVHASCALLNDDIELPSRQDNQSVNHLLGSGDKIKSRRRELGSKLSFAASVRVRVGKCPVCKQGKGDNDTAGQIGSKQQGLLQPGRGVAVAA